MVEMIRKLLEARNAIQQLEGVKPTEFNCNQILASIQRIDAVIGYLQNLQRENERLEREKEEGEITCK